MAALTLTRLLGLEKLVKERSQDSKTLSVLEVIRSCPTHVMEARGLVPDPWQAMLCRSTAPQVAMLTARQCGKTETAAAIALRTALLRDEALVLLLSPSERQSKELMRKVQRFHRAVGRPLLEGRSLVLELHLSNGSRIIALPASESTIRGYSDVKLLVVDEAAKVPDELYFAVRPFLGHDGRIVVLSTPAGKRGWFYEEWQRPEDWQQFEVHGKDCTRHSAKKLEREKKSLGPRWFAQEFECAFNDVTGSVFSEEIIQAALVEGDPWFPAVDALN